MSAVLTINLSKIKENYKFCKSMVNCAPVLKCNAYGFGAKEIFNTLYKDGCRSFFFKSYSEVVKLSTGDAKIYILTYDKNFAEEIWCNNYIPVLSSVENALHWRNVCTKFGYQKLCVIHVETGLNRLAMPVRDLHEILSKEFKVDFLMNHFASAYSGDFQAINSQLSIVQNVYTKYSNIKWSLSSSSGFCVESLWKRQSITYKTGTNDYFSQNYDFNYHSLPNNHLLRLGRFLYGSTEGVYCKPHNHIKPIAQLKCEILSIQKLDEGMSVGYDFLYTAQKSHHIAIIDIGYGDGFHVQHGYVIYKSQNKVIYRCNIIGTISMDYTVIDLSNIPNNLIVEGEFVEIFGEHISLRDVSHFMNRTAFELTTNLGSRIKRKYI